MTVTSRYVAAILASYAAGLIGSLFMSTNFDIWYEALAKPPLMPHASVFPIVWLFLYASMGLAFGMLWSKTTLWHPWVGCFFVSLLFNAAWVMFFFGFHTIFIALVDAVCLFIIIVALELGAWEIDRRAAYLLIPYLLWMAFALYLNAGIWLLS